MPYGADPDGVWFNRVHSYEAGEGAAGRTVHFPRSCLHCESRPASRSARPAPPTSGPRTASCWSMRTLHRLQAVLLGLPLRRARVRRGCRRHEEMHALHRPHLQREPRPKPTACRPASPPARPRRAISAISAIPTPPSRKLVAERGGYDLMPEMGYTPTNKYLPPRPRQRTPAAPARRRQAAPAPPRRRACWAGSSLAALGRSRAVATRLHASRLLRHLLHHGLRRRLRAAGPARRPRRRSSILPPDRWLRLRRASRWRSALITVGLLVLDLHLGRPRARLARLLAMAHLLAVARRRRCRSRPTCRPALFGIGWVFFGQAVVGWPPACSRRSARSSPSAARHDLCRR